jgi:hypothetical protein
MGLKACLLNFQVNTQLVATPPYGLDGVNLAGVEAQLGAQAADQDRQPQLTLKSKSD